MPRGKIQMSLIGDARDRAKAFARRKTGLVKKAKELAKLCDVDVAVVVCAGAGAPVPVVWESSDTGVVIDRYRRLPADKRAKHTYLDYIDGQLGKEKRRLDKKRMRGLDAALACPGEAVLKDMDLVELLASIDKALLATAERQKALGVAGDDGQQLGQQVSSDAVVPVVVGPPFVGGDDHDLDDIQAWVDELMWDDDSADPLQLNNNVSTMQPAASGVIQYNNNGNDADMATSHQCQAQMLPASGENGYGGQFPWHAYQPNTTVSYPNYYGSQCTGNNYYGDMDEYSDMPVQSNAYDGCWYDQASWGAHESSCGVVPVLPAAAYPSSLDIAGNPAYMPPQHEHASMAIGSLMDAGGHEYEVSGCLADYLECPDVSQDFGHEPEPLHYYLSDMANGISYYDDLEAGGCSSGTAQLFAQSHSCSGSGTPQFSGSHILIQEYSIFG